MFVVNSIIQHSNITIRRLLSLPSRIMFLFTEGRDSPTYNDAAPSVAVLGLLKRIMETHAEGRIDFFESSCGTMTSRILPYVFESYCRSVRWQLIVPGYAFLSWQCPKNSSVLLRHKVDNLMNLL